MTDRIVCEINGTDFAQDGENRVISLHAEPSGPGVIGTAEIGLSAMGGGGYVFPVGSEVKLYTVNEAETHVSRRVFGGFTSARTTSARYPSAMKTFVLPVVDYNVLLKRLVGRAADGHAIEIPTGTFSEQIIAAVQQTQDPPGSLGPGPSAFIDPVSYVADLLGSGVTMEGFRVKGQSLGRLLRNICNRAVEINPYLRPAFYIGLDPQVPSLLAAGFGSPVLHVYDLVARGARAGDIARIVVTNGGSGYGIAPDVSFSGGGGSSLAATAVVQNGSVVYVQLTSPGINYTSAPTVVFDNTGTGGTGAAATAVLNVADIYFNETGTGTAPNGQPYKTWIGSNGYDRTVEGGDGILTNWRQAIVNGSHVITSEVPDSIATYPNPYDADEAWKDEPLEDNESPDADRAQMVLDHAVWLTAFPREMNDLVTFEWVVPGQKAGIANTLEGLDDYIYHVSGSSVEFDEVGNITTRLTVGNRWLLPGEDSDEELGAPPVEYDRVPPFPPTGLTLVSNTYNPMTGAVDLGFEWVASESRDVAGYYLRLEYPAVDGQVSITFTDTTSIVVSMRPAMTFAATVWAEDYAGNISQPTAAFYDESVPAVTESIFNGGFEIPDIADPTGARGWTWTGTGDAERTLTPYSVIEGVASFFADIDAGESVVLTSTKYKVVAGGSYEFSAGYVVPTASTSTYDALIRFYDETLTHIPGEDLDLALTGGSGSPLSRSVVYDVPAGAAVADVVFTFDNPGGGLGLVGQIYLDDVRVNALAVKSDSDLRRGGGLSSRGATKLFRMFTPEDLGAEDNGGIPDEVDFLGRLNALPAGSTVRFQGRLYDLAVGGLEITNRLVWEFEGGGFVQTSAGTTNGPLFHLSGSGADGTIIRDIRLFGSETDATWTNGNARRGILVDGVTDFLIENPFVENKTYGIYLLDSLYGVIVAPTIRSFQTELLVGANNASGLRVYGGGWHKIIGLDASQVGSGFSVVGGLTEHVTFLNPTVRTFFDNGGYLSGGKYCEIIGARIYGDGHGTGVKLRGSYHRCTKSYVTGSLFGYAMSGQGYSGTDGTWGVEEIEYNGATLDIVGRGNVFEDVTVENVLAGGIEVQDRPMSDGGPQHFPAYCSINNARIINACTDAAYAGNYGLLLRGHFNSASDILVVGYGGTAWAVNTQGPDAVHDVGQVLDRVRVFNTSGGGVRILNSDYGTFRGLEVAGTVGRPAIQLASSNHNELSESRATIDIPGVGFALTINDDSDWNNVHDNEVDQIYFGTASNNTFRDNIHYMTLSDTYIRDNLGYSMPGESANDLGLSGLYDRNVLTNLGLTGTITVAITGAGTYTNTASEKNKLVDGDGGQYFTLSGLDATTTQVRFTFDAGANVPLYDTVAARPFLQYRQTFDNIHTYFRGISFEVSPNGTTWYSPAGGEWATSAADADGYDVTGLWRGGTADPAVPGNSWRYARVTLTDIVRDAGNPDVALCWISELGIRKVNAPYAPQFYPRAGGLLYGDLLMGPERYIQVGSVAALPTASSTYRGFLARVDGGAGVADTFYICHKNASDVYAWTNMLVITDAALKSVANTFTQFQTFVGQLINTAQATNGDIAFQVSGVNRWLLRRNTTAEAGANAGSNLEIRARTDAGADIGAALTLARSNLNATFGGYASFPNGNTGTFTCSAAATTAVANTRVTGACRVLVNPTNAAAATLQGSAKHLYTSAKTAGVGFSVTTGNGVAALGTETFDYWVIN